MGAGGQWAVGLLWAIVASALADSWTAYQEPPCCLPVSHHRVRHHRGESSHFLDTKLIWNSRYLDTNLVANTKTVHCLLVSHGMNGLYTE